MILIMFFFSLLTLNIHKLHDLIKKIVANFLIKKIVQVSFGSCEVSTIFCKDDLILKHWNMARSFMFGKARDQGYY
jgi:hypothetical protein